MLIVDANHKAELLLGYQGESERTCVQFNMEAIAQEYPGGVVTLLVKRPGDTNPYPVLLVQDGDIYSWYIGVADTSFDGDGECQLTYQVGTVIVKTHKWPTHILESMTGATVDPPDPWESFVEDVLAAADEVMKAVRTVPETINAALEEAKESGEFDGYSPTVRTETITGGHRVIVTDAEGEHKFNVMDGTKGDTGTGIASIVLNPDYTLTINMTDGSHYTTESIRGETGKGISSVTLNQDYTLTITYTDGTNTTTGSIRGATGATPDISIGTVETLPAGSAATASMTGTPEHPVLNLGIPEGEQGVPGEVTLAQLMTRAPVIIETVEGGSIVTAPDGADSMPIKNLVVGFIPKQSGTPTPDNHCAISGWTGLNVVRAGKNLYSILLEDDVWGQGFNGGSTEKVSDGLKVNMAAQLYSGSYSQTALSTIRLLSRLTGTATYSVEVKCSTSKEIHLGFNGYGKRKVNLTTDWQRIVFTADFNGNETSFQIYNADANACTVWLRNFQFEFGSVATDYKTYEGTTFPVSWVTEAGTVYGGRVNIITGELIGEWAEITLPDSGYVIRTSGTGTGVYVAFNPRISGSLVRMAYNENKVGVYAEAAKGITRAARGQAWEIYVSNETNLAMFVPADATSESVAAAIGGTKAVIQLETPVTYQLTPAEVATLLGINNISVADSQAISAEYCADTKMYIDRLTKSDTDMIADADIPSGKYFSVNNRLFLSTAAIARGSAVVPYSNCVETSIAEALNNLNS